MSVVSNIPAPSLPVIGPDGRISPIWWQFFLTLFARTGGAQGETPDDQRLAPAGDAGLPEIFAQLLGLRDVVHMVPPMSPAIPLDDQAPGQAAAGRTDDPDGRISALEAQVQRLQTDIEAIRQGQQL